MIPELRAVGQVQPDDSQANLAADPGDEGTTAPSTPPVSATEESGEVDELAPNPGDSPEIAEHKKQLVAAFHKRLSKQNQELEKYKDFDAYKREAEAFRVLMSQKGVADKLSGGEKPEGGQPQTQGFYPPVKELLPKLPEYARGAVDAQYHESMLTFQMGALEALGAPQLVQLVNTLWSERQENLAKTATSDLEGAEPFLAEAKALAARTGLSIRQAALALGDGKVLPKQQQKEAAKRAPDVPAMRANGRPAPNGIAQRAGPQGKVSDEDVARELAEIDALSENPRFNMFRRG